MGRSRIAYWTGFFALAATCVAAPAGANSDICQRLEARLVALESNPGNDGVENFRKSDRAVRQQRNDLDRATDEARRAGCLGGFFKRAQESASCNALMATINRMRANMNRLTAARERASGDPFGNRRERDDLVEALAANRCGGQYEMYDRPSRSRGFFATLFGGGMFRDHGWGGGYDSNFGTFRTLCVRTCDGYYFPISFSTVSSHFAGDEQACRSRCPGTDVALYIHRNPGQESEDMVSLAGEPYTLLPTAFRYRGEYDRACSCGKIATVPPAAGEIAGYTPVQGNDPWAFARRGEVIGPLGAVLPVPIARPEESEDPETLANRAGGMVPEPVEAPEATIAGLGPDGKRTVRIVGPTYYYAQ
jgi:hypothetical protein